MEEDIHHYSGESVDVTYDVKRCIHAAECIRGLPSVFDKGKRPWVEPDNSDPDQLTEVITRCPTGALHFERSDGGASETVPDENSVTIVPDGPHYLRGDIELVRPDGTTLLEDTRVALCRCGASSNKPLCDNSHREIGFTADGQIREKADNERAPQESKSLRITPTRNGPLELDGPFELSLLGDATSCREDHATFCRCGGSGDKPFCDGTHERIGFTTDEE
ncbi:CDGSH iron-sulfur domain-containing protein [Haloferax sp. YSSS75]|uniref:CDGSH iron-sulfur domain-containing protein n=1 Tax=Haloferax sp. YSSS75 TaxID=3388564 RepID=UPI00398D4274